MQPTKIFKKTLLAGALILGAGNAFNASADLIPVVAEAVPDVSAVMVAGFTQVSFGSAVIGNKIGGTCSMAGISAVDDADMLFNAAGAAANPNLGNTNGGALGTLTGTACVDGDGGEVMIIEIDGADSSTVSVTVADVIGAEGWTYTPTTESCVINFDGGLGTVDTCDSLALNTVTGIGMSAVQTNAIAAAADMEVLLGWQGYLAMTGKTRMILAGSITLSADLGQGAIISNNIIVQVTYE